MTSDIIAIWLIGNIFCWGLLDGLKLQFKWWEKLLVILIGSWFTVGYTLGVTLKRLLK